MFQRCTKTESWLNQHGVQYAYVEDVLYTELTPDWCRVNLGRPNSLPVDDDLCLGYAMSMENGAVFPAPILADTAAGKEVLEGVQRIKSGEINDYTRFNAYVIRSVTSETRQRIRVCANAILNGKRESESFTVKQVVDLLYEQQRMTIKECSVWSGIHPRVLDVEVQVRIGKSKLEQLGVDVTTKPASNREFQVECANVIDDGILQSKRARGEIHQAIAYLQRAKCNNGEAVPIIRRYRDIKPKKGVEPATQFASVTAQWTSEEYWKGRLIDGRRSHSPTDNFIMHLKKCETTAKAMGGIHCDSRQSETIKEIIKRFMVPVRHAIPREYWDTDTTCIAIS